VASDAGSIGVQLHTFLLLLLLSSFFSAQSEGASGNTRGLGTRMILILIYGQWKQQVDNRAMVWYGQATTIRKGLARSQWIDS